MSGERQLRQGAGMTKNDVEHAIVDGPALVRAGHVRERALSATAGGKKGWSRLAGYERAYNKGQLVCKEGCKDAAAAQAEERRAHDRFAAAKALDLGWHSCMPSFPGRSDLDRVRSSGGGALACASRSHARDAKDFWRRVQAAIGGNDWRICFMVCCEGYEVSEAVAAVSPAYKYAALARFREALDALADGMRAAKRMVKQEPSTKVIARAKGLAKPKFHFRWILSAGLAIGVDWHSGLN